MFSRIKKLFDNNTEIEPKTQNISDLVFDLEQGITSAQESIDEAKKNENKLKKNIELLFKDYDKNKSVAKKMLQSGQKSSAESLLKKVNLLERQISEYGKLLSNVESTILELEEQKAHFQIKKEEFSSKEFLYQLKIKGAQNHAELNETIMSTLNSDELSSYEDMLLNAKAKAEAISEINDDFSLNHETEQSSNISNLEEEINLEIQKKEEEAFAKQQAKISLIFNQMDELKVPKTRHEPQQEAVIKSKMKDFFSDNETNETKQRLNKFFEQQNLDKSKQDKISNFFNK